jgi:hypothetical protein
MAIFQVLFSDILSLNGSILACFGAAKAGQLYDIPPFSLWICDALM